MFTGLAEAEVELWNGCSDSIFDAIFMHDDANEPTNEPLLSGSDEMLKLICP
jgi:hypothetical protein